MSSEVTERVPGLVQWRLAPSWNFAYAYVFFISVFIGQTIRFFVGSEPWVGAQSGQILIPLVAFATSVVLWVLSPLPVRSPSGLLALFFGLLILVWLWALIRDWGASDLTSLTLGPFLVMLATKCPPPAAALQILNTLGALVLVGFASAALFAVVTDVPATGFTAKWPPLTDPFDPIGMWWAPFNGPAESGAVGAFLVLVGIAQRRWFSVMFVAGGLVILFLSGTLSAALGLCLGLLVLLLGLSRNSSRRRAVRVVVGAVGLVGFLAIAREIIANPSLSGRTFIWSDFVAIAQDSPIVGSGTGTLIRLEQVGSLPDGTERLYHGSDAHNIFLDAWARYGVFALLAVSLLITVAIIVGVRGYKHGQCLGLALIVTFIAIGLVESNLWWSAPGTGLTLLLLGVLLADAASNNSPDRGIACVGPHESTVAPGNVI